jgi:putative inorganic carbon (HCO3(-)) transporter
MLKKIINFNIYLIVFSLPLYLVHFKISWVPFNLLEIMIYILFGLWLFFGVRNRQILNSKFQIPILLIFFGATISTIFSTDLETSAGIWKGWFLAPLLFFVAVINQIKTKNQIKNIFISLFSSGAIVGLLALFYWLNNNLTYDGRLRAFYLSPNHLAMYLSPILILSLYLYFVFKNNIFKIILFVSYCLLFIVIYLTYSYGAWLGLLGALVFLLGAGLLKGFLKEKKSFLYLVGFVFLLIILGFLLQIPSQKFQGILDLSYPSLKSRLVIWQSAWEIIKDHPLIGIGPGMFQKYYLDYQSRFAPYPEWAVPQPHNLFLAFWLQVGLLGLVGFIWLLVQFFRSLTPKKLSIILMATIVSILIHGLVDTTYWKNDLSVIFWLIIALDYKASRLSD